MAYNSRIFSFHLFIIKKQAFNYDPNLLRNELDLVAQKLARRGYKLDVDTIRELEDKRKILQVETENLQAERNTRSKSIGEAKARGEDISSVREEVIN